MRYRVTAGADPSIELISLRADRAPGGTGSDADYVLGRTIQLTTPALGELPVGR